MTLEELLEQLESLGYPVAYSHFKTKKRPPFIVYLVKGTTYFFADNEPYHELIDVDIELYVTNKNMEAEQKIKDLLNKNGLLWDYYEQFVESEGVFQCTFSVQLSQKSI